MNRRTTPVIAALGAITLAIALAACSGSSDGGDTSSTSAADGGSATDPDVLAAAEAQLKLDQEGLYTSPPTEGPTAQAGKNVIIVPCGTAAPGCSVPADGMVDAAEALGWNTTVIDGELNPTGYQDAMRQAIAAGPDGIMTTALSCTDIKPQLQAAIDAGIPVVGGPSSFDCDATDDGPNLYTAMINLGGTPVEFNDALGAMRANYIIAKTGGNAKIIMTEHSDFLSTTLSQAGFDRVIATCGGCEIVATVDIAAGDLGVPATVQQKVATVLQQHPEANVLVSASDTVLGQIGQTLRQNNNPDLIVIGSESYPDTLDLMREGYSTAASAYSQDWGGWATADTLNRIFAEGDTAEIPDSGMNLQMIDKDHGLNPEMGTPYTPSFDYKEIYEKVWSGK